MINDRRLTRFMLHGDGITLEELRAVFGTHMLPGIGDRWNAPRDRTKRTRTSHPEYVEYIVLDRDKLVDWSRDNGVPGLDLLEFVIQHEEAHRVIEAIKIEQGAEDIKRREAEAELRNRRR